MIYLLDTNHWSYIQRGHPAVIQHLQQLPASTTLLMPVVTLAELLVGVNAKPPGKRRDELRVMYERSLAIAAEIVPIGSGVAEQFASIHAELVKKGRPIATNDLWIAAIARANNWCLVTNDADFLNVPNLTIEDWTQPSDSLPEQ